MVIDDDDIIKVHIHTNHPGWVLERALDFGSLSDIKIDNLREQHMEQLQKKEYKKLSVITVAAGDGIKALFEELGADFVVSGGQTMNPSADDILEAIEDLNAERILILPNNGNIILTAQQAADMTDKNVYVIKTKTVPQGIAAMLAMDADAEDPTPAMEEAVQNVQTGLLTNAVRDTEMDGMKICKDDFLALSDGKIVGAAAEEGEALSMLFDALISEESFAVTLFYGEDVAEEEAQGYADKISEKWADAEVSILYGGQPVYRYMLSVE